MPYAVAFAVELAEATDSWPVGDVLLMPTKPVVLTVDDDPEVLRAIERDLRRQYADRYRVLRADSGEAALETLRQLKTRNDPVALLNDWIDTNIEMAPALRQLVRVLFEYSGPRDRSLSDRHAAYYERRARGGCGVVVTEVASVHESDWPYERAPLASSCETGWASVSAACAPF